MIIFGTEVNEKCIVAFAAGSIFGGGFFYVAYKLLSRRSKAGQSIGKRGNNNNDAAFEADLMLPVTLEKEYGDCLKTCLTSDESASAFLKQLPEHFFQFQEKFAQLITSTLENRKCTRALVIGSKTGALTFNLSKLFSQVKGIERSFSQVATCYRLQNLDKVEYFFPLEGSLKTASRTITSPLLQQTLVDNQTRKRNKIKEHERIEILNCEPSDLPDYFGEFELVVVNNCLNEVCEPEKFFNTLSKTVESNGILVISSDYNWNRDTNLESGFAGLPVTNTFELLRYTLQRHFTLIKEESIPDAFCVSNRTCHISNNHVTLWARNSD